VQVADKSLKIPQRSRCCRLSLTQLLLEGGATLKLTLDNEVVDGQVVPGYRKPFLELMS